MSLLPKIVRGSATNVLEQAVRLGCALWITPRMVYYLGEAGFGLWGLLSGIFAHFILLDLGLCTSLPRFLARGIGRNDLDDLRRTASTGMLGMVIIGAVAQAAGLVIWFSLPYFLSETHALEDARMVVIALMVATLAYWIHRPILLHLQSQLRRDLISLTAITRVIISTPLVAWALGRGDGIVTVAWIHTFSAVGELVFLGLLGRSFFSLLQWRWVSKTKARELMQFARWSYLLTTTERIRSSFTGSDIFIIAAMLGTAASGIYSLGQKLAFMFYEVVYSIVGAQLLSAFSHLDGAGDQEGLERGFIAASRIAMHLAVIGGGMLWAIGPAFLARWVPEQAQEATPVLMILIVPHMLGAAQIPARHLLISLAKHRFLALTYLAGIFLNLGLTLLLVRKLGMIGAAYAATVEMVLIYAIVMPWLTVRQAGLPWRIVAWEGLWKPLLRGGLLLAPALVLVRRWLDTPDYSHITVAILALSALFFLLAALGLLGREEKKWLKMGWLALVRSQKPAARPGGDAP